MSDLFQPTGAVTYATSKAATAKTSASSNTAYLNRNEKDNLTLSMEDFLVLLVKQFQNQDIENPASTSDMLNQLMQMSTIQSMATMTDASTMTYAASLVGKEVTLGEVDNRGVLTEIVGTVTGTGTYNGERVIFVNGKSYPLTAIMSVGRLPENQEDGSTEDGSTEGGSTEGGSTEGGDSA